MTATTTTRATCRRCDQPLAVELAGADGVHVLCCDPACDQWPCDGTHTPGRPRDAASGSFFGFLPDRPRVPVSGGWCVSCSAPVDVPGGVCCPLCLARLAHKHAPWAYEPALGRP